MAANIYLDTWISFNIIINIETGFYELVAKSKLETAKKFRQWVLYLLTFYSLNQFYLLNFSLYLLTNLSAIGD